MPLDQDLKLTLASIGGALESIGVTWAIWGSFASTIHGEARSTNDIDVSGMFGGTGREAARRRAGRRLLRGRVDDRGGHRRERELQRHRPAHILESRRRATPAARRGSADPAAGTHAAGWCLYVLGPEDTALQKLRWYQLTGETSDRQWRDIMGVAARHAGRRRRLHARRSASNRAIGCCSTRSVGSCGHLARPTRTARA